MKLLPESLRPKDIIAFFCEHQQPKYESFATPSMKNLLKIFAVVRRKKYSLNTRDEEGNHIEIKQVTFRHWFQGEEQDVTTTKGVRIAVRQKLPEHQVHGEKYFSIIMSRDGEGEVQLATCVVRPAVTRSEQEKYGNYIRVGDLRTDIITTKGKFETGIVDGNDDDLGLPTGRGFIDGQSFDYSMTRAYLLLVKTLFHIGEVAPLGSSRQINKGLLTTRKK